MASNLCAGNQTTRVCTATPVAFEWSTDQFAGAHDRDSPTGINDLVSAPARDNVAEFSRPGSVVCVNMESFCPTAVGAGRYAQALEAALAADKHDS